MQREGSVLFLSLLWLPPAAVPYPVSILSYYVIQSASFLLTWPSSNRRFINLLQVVTKFIMWLKMKRIWRSDRRLEWERWIHFSRSGFLALVTQEKFLFWPFLPSLIDQTCSVKVAWFCWPSFFFRFFKQTWSTEHISEGTRCLSSAHFRVGCFNVKYISYNCSFYFDRKPENPQLCNLQTRLRRKSGAPNDNIVQNHLNIAFLNVF